MLIIYIYPKRYVNLILKGGIMMKRGKKLVSVLVLIVFLTQTFFSNSMININSTFDTGGSVIDSSEGSVIESNVVKETVSTVPKSTPTYSATRNGEVVDGENIIPKNQNTSNINISEKAMQSKKRVIVKYRNPNNKDAVKQGIASKKQDRKVESKSLNKFLKMEALEIEDTDRMEAILEELKQNNNIEYAQPDYELETYLIPQDDRFNEQWGLSNTGQAVNGQVGKAGVDINAISAWDFTTGSDNVTVAVIDTGVDINHTDLLNNIYINTKEQVNGVDDDGNGLVDDIKGWDYANNDNGVYDSDSLDAHGTHIAGIIAAGLNNGGISGIAPNIKILPIKFINGNTGYTSDAIKAIEYAKDMGASIVNCSWGGSQYNQALKEVMEQSGMLFTCAAGNNGTNLDLSPIYPACFDLSNIITASAVNSNGQLAFFSCFGSKINVVAPGVDILSTLPGNKYGYMSGTSVAAPFVAGTAALVKNTYGALTAQDIKARILNNVTKIQILMGKVSSSGILNLAAALLNQGSSSDIQPSTGVDPTATVTANATATPTPGNEAELAYDTSAEGNNKIPKPIIASDNLFIDAVVNNHISKIAPSGNGIENLSINRLKEKYITVVWTTTKKANTEFLYGKTQNLNKSYKYGGLSTKHQATVRIDNINDINYYMVKSVTADGTVLKTNIRAVKDDITDLGGKDSFVSVTDSIYTSKINAQHVSIQSYMEDNNSNHSFDSAQAISQGTVFGTMQQESEEDYYAVYLESGKNYKIKLKGIVPEDDYDIHFFGSSEEYIWSSCNYDNLDEEINHTAQYSGTYYVQVLCYDYDIGAANHNYQLDVYSDDSLPDLYEPNDSSIIATPVTNDSVTEATINVTTDEDWYVLDTDKTGKISVTMKSIPSNCDYDIEVYYENSSNLLRGSYASSNRNEKIDYLINTPGKYYIRVYPFGGTKNPDDSYEMKVGVYTPDQYEVSDDIFNVNIYGNPTINLNSYIYATVDNQEDVDYYRFVISEDTKVGIWLQNIPLERNYNLSLYRFENGEPVEKVFSNQQGNLDESIVSQLSHGTYFIKVYSSLGYSDTDNYRLSLSESPGDVSLTFDKTNASVDEIVTATIRLNNINELAGYQINLKYDPQVVKPVQEDLSDYNSDTIPSGRTFMSNSAYSPFVIASNELEKGVLNFGACYLDIDSYRGNGVDEKSGIIGVIKFKVLKNNQIQLRFENSESLYSGNCGVSLNNWNGYRIRSGFIINQPQIVNEGLPVNPSNLSSYSTTDIETQGLTQQVSTLVCKVSGYVLPDLTSSFADIKQGFKITLINQATKAKVETLSDINGYFQFNNITSNNYTVEITKGSYLKRVLKDVVVFLGDTSISTQEEPIMMWAGDIPIPRENSQELQQDNNINIADIVFMAKSFNSAAGDSNYNINVDLNMDNAINMADVMIIAIRFNKSSNSYPKFENKLFKDEEVDILKIENGTLDLNGHTLTVNGDAIITTDPNGANINIISTLNINGGRLYVGGNLIISQYGRLYMRNPRDYILVNGSFITGSKINHATNAGTEGVNRSNLSDGVLEIKGDFIQNSNNNLDINGFTVSAGDPYNFNCSGRHKVIMNGINKQKIVFDRTRVNIRDGKIVQNDQSYFNTLVITRPLVSGYELKLQSDATIAWLNLDEQLSGLVGDTENISNYQTAEKTSAPVATVGAKIYVFGGYNGTYYLTGIDEHDPVAGSCVKNKYTLNVPRSNAAAVAVNNNQIYVIGGENNITGQNTNGFVNKVEDFSNVTGASIMSNVDPVTSIDKCIMPSLRSKTAAAAVGSCIYVIGGDEYNQSAGRIEISDKVEVFDVENREWKTGFTPMPTKRSGATAVSLDGYIYVIGGFDGSKYLDTVEKYDPVSNSWTTCTDMSQKRAALSASVVNGKIYAIGGFNGTDHLAVVEEYNPQSENQVGENPWRSRKPVVDPLNKNKEEPRSSFGTAVVYNQIYLLGGENKNGYVTKPQKYLTIVLPGQTLYTGELHDSFSMYSSESRFLKGDYVSEISDIKIESTGIPIELTRKYNSSDRYEQTVVGKGWRFNYDMYLQKKIKYGRVIASLLHIRQGKSTKTNILASAYRGAVLELSLKSDGTPEIYINEGITWCKVKCLKDKSGNFLETYAAIRDSKNTFIEIIDQGMEFKNGPGSSIYFDGNDSNFKSPFGCYDLLKTKTSDQEYILLTNDMTRYGFTRAENAYTFRLSWIEDKYQNKITIGYDSAYRINKVSDKEGRSLTFDYTTTAGQLKVTDGKRNVVYFINDSTGNLDKVFNMNDKYIYYTYMTEQDDKSDDKKNVNKLTDISIDDRNNLNQKSKVLTNSYNEVTGRRYKETTYLDYNDTVGKVRYWICLDALGDENSSDDKVIGTIERHYNDENNNKTVTKYDNYLKLPVSEQYPDGSKVEYVDQIKYNGTWYDTSKLTKADFDKISSNRETRKYVKDRYGYTTLSEVDINGNPRKVTNKFIDSDANHKIDSNVLSTKYLYDYSYDSTNFRLINNLTKEWKQFEGTNDNGLVEEGGYTEYIYEGTYREKLARVASRISYGNTSIYQEDNSLVRKYDQNGITKQWTSETNAEFSGEKGIKSNNAGDYVEFTFTGIGIRWLGLSDKSSGKARVIIDGGAPSVVDTYYSTNYYGRLLYENRTLSEEEQSHTIKIVVDGTKNSLSSDSFVNIDCFQVIRKNTNGSSYVSSYQDNSTSIKCYDTNGNSKQWTLESNTKFSGGTVISSNVTGDYVEFTFVGSGIRWVGFPKNGIIKAQVSLDNGTPTPVNITNASDTTARLLYEKLHLKYGEHKIKIAVDSTGYANIDYLQVVNNFALTLYQYYNNGYYSSTSSNDGSVNGLIRSVTNPDGKVTSYTYYKNGYIYTVKDPANQSVTPEKVIKYMYDSIGRKTSEVTPMGFKTKYIYNNDDLAQFNTTSETANAMIIYDEKGDITQRPRSTIKCSTTKIIYDGYGNKIQEITPKQYEKSLVDTNKGTSYVYDLKGRVITASTILTDDTGSKITEYVTEYTYDNAGNKQEEKTYEKVNDYIELLDLQHHIYEYDNMNRLYRVSFKTPNIADPVILEEYTYETEPNADKPTLNDIKTHKVYYKASANQYECSKTTIITDYSARTETTKETGKADVIKGYFKNGNLEYEQTDSNKTTYWYDGLGRVTRKRTPIEKDSQDTLYTSLTKYYYSNAGNLIDLSTGMEKVTISTEPWNYITELSKYDNSGRIIQSAAPEGVLKSFQYDYDGNLKQEITYTGSTTDIKKIEYRNNCFGKPDYKFEFVDSQDIEGAPVSTNYAIVTKCLYDANGNLIEEQTKHASITGTTIETYTYNEAGPILVKYAYDDINRLTAVKKKGKILDENALASTGNYSEIETDIETSTAYDWEGNPVKTIDSNGNTTNYKYFYIGSGRVELTTTPIYEKQIYKGDLKQASFYDWAGRLIAEVSPENYPTDLTHDEDINYTNINHIQHDYNYTDGKLQVEERYFGSLKQYTPDNLSTTTSYSTLPTGQLIKRTEYDLYGNVIKEWDATGSDLSMYEYGYNLMNKVIWIINPHTRELNTNAVPDYFTIKYDYDTFGRKTSETKIKGFNATANDVKYESGQNEKLYYVNTAYEYDSNGNILKIWTKMGDTNTVDAKDGGQLMLDDKYNLAGNIISHTDAMNTNATDKYSTTYEYNKLHKIRTVHYPVDSNMKYETSLETYDVSYTYDAMENTRKEYDNMQKVNLYTYDASGRQLSETEKRSTGTTDSEIITTSVMYDRNGNRRVEIDGRSNKNENTFDSINRLIELKVVVNDNLDQEDLDVNNKDDYASTHIISYTYNGDDSVIEQTEKVKRGAYESTSTHNFNYDELNRLIEKTINGTSVEKIIYNINSLQEYSFNALDKYTKFEYDNSHRLIRTTHQYSNDLSNDEVNHTQGQTYDFAGNVRTKTDGEGNTTNFIYDEYDRLWYVINPKDRTNPSTVRQKIRYTYDKNNNILKQEILQTNESENDIIFQKTSYAYTVANDIQKKTDNWNKSEEYKYDPNGNLRYKLFKNNAYTVFNYDIHGRLKNELTKKDGLTTEKQVEISYDYDNNGNLLTVTDSPNVPAEKVETKRTYDTLNRVKTKTVTNIGEVKYYYDRIVNDQEGSLTAETSKDPKGNITSKVNDRNGRLKYVVNGDLTPVINQATGNTKAYEVNLSTAVKYEYNPDGTRSLVTYPGGAREEYDYYFDGLLKTLNNRKSDGTVINSYTYTYDGAHNISSKDESSKGITSYSYDELNRLKIVNEQAINRITSYTFDNAGNRKTEKIEYGTTTLYEYNYDTDGKILLTKKVNDVINDQIEYNYDANGNQTTVIRLGSTTPETSNSYDLLNRLITTTTGGKTIVNKYDGSGLRVEKSVTQGSLTTTTRYLYEYDKVVLELDQSGNKIGRNIYGTNLLMRQAENLDMYYMYNGHADVTALVDASTGNIRATYYYDAFGNVQQENYFDANGNTTTTPVKNNIMYAGYQYDKETGLYYLNSRMYDPKTARFLQEDTYTGDPSDPMSLNLYTYCKNEPIMHYDPSGYASIIVHIDGKDYYPEEIEYYYLGKKNGKAIQAKVDGVKGSMDDNLGQFFDIPAVNNIRFNMQCAIIRVEKDVEYINEISQKLKDSSLSESKRKDYEEKLKHHLDNFNKNYNEIANYGLTFDGSKVVKDDYYYTALAKVYYKSANEHVKDFQSNEYFAPFEAALQINSAAQAIYTGAKFHDIMLKNNAVNYQHSITKNKGAYAAELSGSYTPAKPSFINQLIDKAKSISKPAFIDQLIDKAKNASNTVVNAVKTQAKRLITDKGGYIKIRPSSGNGTGVGGGKKLSDSHNINSQIVYEYDEIRLGNGNRNLDTSGNQKIYQGRENKNWTGAEEYDVLKRNKDGSLVVDSKGNPIETDNRILVLRDSSGNITKMGYVEGHNYNKIKTFPEPWFPDGGKK